MNRNEVSRHRLVSLPLFALAAALLVSGAAQAAQTPQLPLAGSAVPQFVNQLPVLSVWPDVAPGMPTIDTIVAGAQPITLRMCEFQSSVLPPGATAPGITVTTATWGYVRNSPGSCAAARAKTHDTYLGPVIVADRGTPTEIAFVNDLGNVRDTQVLAWKYSTDQTLHWADPGGTPAPGMPSMGQEGNMCNMTLDGTNAVVRQPWAAFGQCTLNYGETSPKSYTTAAIPAVPHLHGGEVPPFIDGGPNAWFLSDGSKVGSSYYTKTVPALPATVGPAGQVVVTPDNRCWESDGAQWLPTTVGCAVYRYPNTQESGPLWFHDHTLGATRLNVYAGLAGAYYLRDPNLALPNDLSDVTKIVPVVLQDRMFDTAGQLFFTADSAGGLLWALNPEHPYWNPEFVGDSVLVNGKAWPFLNVGPNRYRFLVLNGSNARTYDLSLINQATGSFGPPMWVIGNDGGLLAAPVKLDPALGQNLTIMPGERYEVVIDFTGFPAGTNFILRNTGRTPYPKGAPPPGSTLGRAMLFKVAACPAGGCQAALAYDPAVTPAIRTVPRLAGPTVKRQLTLNEIALPGIIATDPVTGIQATKYPGGPFEILVNNTKWSGASGRTFNDFTVRASARNANVVTGFSELPAEGVTEQWEIVNLTADAHPIHLHLVQFQLLNRQGFNVNKYNGAYALAFPAATAFNSACIGGVFCPAFGPPANYNLANLDGAVGGNPAVGGFLQGPIQAPLPQESGWKDTVLVPPGMVTRFLVRWAPTGGTPTFPFDPSGGFDPATGTIGASYVWHCHIIDHEDNEMMRPDVVTPTAGASRTYVKGVDY